MYKLILIRGPSGSGKSTIRQHIASIDGFNDWYKQCETDIWFMGCDKNGDMDYKFDGTKLHQAHMWCRLEAEKHMRYGDNVVVANTSMTLKELDPFLILAEEYGYEVEVYRTPGPWDVDTLFKRNFHSVPLATLERQIQRYQPYPGEKEWTDLSVFKT